jgi:hypothetical protein
MKLCGAVNLSSITAEVFRLQVICTGCSMQDQTNYLNTVSLWVRYTVEDIFA